MSAARKGKPLANTPAATFARLLAEGYWPVGIWPKGAEIPQKKAAPKIAKGKEPIGAAWGIRRWTLDRWKAEADHLGEIGVGVCLGPERAAGGGWIIDVEADGEAAESSRGLLFDGEIIETAGWSSRRGDHQLLTVDAAQMAGIVANLKGFEARDENDKPKTGVFKLPGLPDLELRIGGYKDDGRTIKQIQSICPPTLGEDDRARAWTGDLIVKPAPPSFYRTLAGLIVPKGKPARAVAKPNPFISLAVVAVSSEGARNMAWTRKAVADELGKLSLAVDGNRNDSLNRAAYAIGRFIPRYLARDSAEVELRAVAEALGLGIGETEATIRSGIEAGMGNPKERPEKIEATVRPVPAPPVVSPRPIILISTDEKTINDTAIQALTADPDLYCRGPVLVSVRREKRKGKLVNRLVGSPWIAPVPKSTLREKMAHHAGWVKVRKIPNSQETIEAPAHPPDWSVAAVHDRGDWDGIRHLEGIAEAPAILGDGSLLDRPGYDERSGLIYEPNCDFPPVPTQISQADARTAAAEILEVVADFPFAELNGDGGMTHRAAWLASLLTPLARHAIDAPCPLFFIDANVSGAGKSKLCDIVAILVTGRGAARTAFPESDEEMRKQIISIALEGDRLILIDNVTTGAALGGSSLDMVLTGTTVKGRILGKTEMTRELPIYTVWYATGNNLGLKTDMLRRVVPFRLESPHERPEERTDFRIKGSLLKHVEAHRGRLVAAALTILRGFVLAGRPQAALTPMDYPEWSAVVRQAIYWATGIDPCETRAELIADDPETNQLKAIVAGWAELPKGGVGLTAAEALTHLRNPDFEGRFHLLRNALMEWSKDSDLPGPKTIGRHLRQIKGRIIDGKTIRSKTSNGTLSWYVVEIRSGGFDGFNGFASPHARQVIPPQPYGDIHPEMAVNKPIKPIKPTTDPDELERGDAWEGPSMFAATATK